MGLLCLLIERTACPQGKDWRLLAALRRGGRRPGKEEEEEEEEEGLFKANAVNEEDPERDRRRRKRSRGRSDVYVSCVLAKVCGMCP